MSWTQWAGRKGVSEGEGLEPSALSRDRELLHSLHQWLDLCRKAIARGDSWSRPLVRVLTILRELLDARVAVLRVDRPLEALFRISMGSQTSENRLSANGQFLRLCELLFEAPQPLLIADALENRGFVDPYFLNPS